MSERDAVPREEIGYAKPPKLTQFKKGQSGNPSGRPRKKSTPRDVFEKIFNTPLPIKVDGRRKSMTGAQAILLQLRAQCMKGDLAATRVFCQLSREYNFLSGPEDDGKLNELMEVLRQEPAPPGEVNE